jgi:exodeoxyribonuclease VII large subunit
VADVRAATPSNAAEIVVDRADNFRTRIRHAEQGLRRAATVALERRWRVTDNLTHRLENWPTRVVMLDREYGELSVRLETAAWERLSAAGRRLEALDKRLAERDLRQITADLRTRVVRAEGRLAELIQVRTMAKASRARELAGRLDTLSPLAVLGRGYALCWDETRTSIIRSAEAAAPGTRVRVTLAEGELRCKVEDNA